MLNGLDLFSGIGGLTLALREWVNPIAYCEIDRYCQGVLLSRMHNGQLPRAPIWEDIATFPSGPFSRGGIDIIYGGFPCQDLSCAGSGKGLEGKRSGLVFEVFRLIRETKPSFVFLENVPAIRTRGGERVVKELAALGYDCRWDTLSAFDVGAPHKRERWWLLAYRNIDGCKVLEKARLHERNKQSGDDSSGLCNDDSHTDRLRLRNGRQRREEGQAETDNLARNDGEAESMANTDRSGLEIGKQGYSGELKAAFGGGWWLTEPNVGRVANGIPKRVDRLRSLGNAVVPAQAREAFKRLSGLK